MKNVMCGGFAVVVLAVPAVAGAQGHKINDKMDKMKSETTYTGCIERSSDGAFTLGHAMASGATTKKPMAKDSMDKGPMANDSTTHDSMRKESMASTLGLASTSVDLAKYVGHTVTVNGIAGDTMGGLATFNVKSIKLVGSSCS
jgi:hypothetical protein